MLRPETVEQLQEQVSRSRKVKVLGSRHSFNDIADTTGDLVSLENLAPVVAVDRARRTVTVSGRVTFGQLCGQLHREGWALANLASLPHISVAGACATATHGSGDGSGILATNVVALELVTAAGELVSLSRERNGEQFQGVVVGLGGLGVVARLTLNLVPTFEMQQVVYENLPLTELEAHFDDIVASAYSVSLFTDWQEGRVSQVWLKCVARGDAAVTPAPTFYGATRAASDRHPITTLSSENCTPQMGVPGPWHERLPHFRLDHTPSSGAELQSEYIIPRHHVAAVIRQMALLHGEMVPLLQISEVRTIAADTLWMSPCYRQASAAIHFTWEKDWPGVQKLLPRIEERLAPFGARPHWGKLFTMSPSHLGSLYPRLQDFRELLRSYDTEGKFRNAFLDRYIFAAS